MPLIEELPVTTTIRASHGWAYVPETTVEPIHAVLPGSRDNRKRAAATAVASSASHSFLAKQQKAVQQRLDSLDKENYKDGVTVAIPPRSEHGQGRGQTNKKRKTTSANVRRILTYQRTFAHYLADEEANPGANATTTSTSITVMGTGSTSASVTPSTTISTSVNASAMPPPAVPTNAGSKSGDLKSRRRGGAVTPTVSATSGETTNQKKSDTMGPGRGRRKRQSSVTSVVTTPPDSVQPIKPSRRSGRRSNSRSGIKTEAEGDQMEVDTQTPVQTADDTAEGEMEGDDVVTTDGDVNVSTSIPISASTSNQEQQQEGQRPSSLPPPQPPYDLIWDKDPLLRSSDVPKMPSDRVMQILLAEPPLSYKAARTKAVENKDIATDAESEAMPRKSVPKRHFCSICGYFGRVKCKKCGEWTCGVMDCWRGHEGVCVMANTY